MTRSVFSKIRSGGLILLLLLLVGGLLFRLFAAGIADRTMNPLYDPEPFPLSKRAETLHKSLFIVDWHADTLMWPRNLNRRSANGHVDLPRLQDGNVAAQMFTAITQSLPWQNHDSSSEGDQLTLLFIAQGWPVRTWNSPFERALYQAGKLERYIEESGGGMVFIKNRSQFADFIRARQRAFAAREAEVPPVAALLGIEGGEAFEGRLDTIDALWGKGFRMFGLAPFDDNEGTHGSDKAGLTDFGKEAVKRLDALGAMIDLAHASEAMAREVLEMVEHPLLVSHTGFKGNWDVNRNLSDALMVQIAEKGGLIAVSFRAGAIQDPSPLSIAKAILYGIALVGADHIALGSDWDSATKTIGAEQTATLTEALLQAGLSAADIRKVMGENARSFLLANLPE